MATSRYNSGELFCRIQNVQGNSFLEENTVKHDSTSDSMVSDNQVDHTEAFFPETSTNLKRKASSDANVNVHELIYGKKSNKNDLKVRTWTPERVELLLEYPKGYKLTCDFNGKDFEQGLSAMYTKIRRY